MKNSKYIYIFIFFNLANTVFTKKNMIMADLQTTYMGLKLKNPLIAGSSGLTDSLDKLKKLEQKGAAAVVLKSLFEEEILIEMEEAMHQMTSRQLVYPETFDYMDESEEEDSIRKYLHLIQEAKSQLSIPVIASINCVSSQKWTYFAHEIEKAGADALELNMFILPSDFNRSAEENEKIYFDVIKKVQSDLFLPISAKISYYSSNLGQHIQQLSKTDISGIVLFNRFFSPDFDIENFTVTSGHVLSSSNELAMPLRWVAIMADRIDCDIAASTGVHSSDDLIKLLLAGAKAVQIASAIYKEGEDVITTILQGLESWMDKKGFTTVDEFRGKMSQKEVKDPASFERVQFMKHFRHFVET